MEQPNIENNSEVDAEMNKWEEDMTIAGVSPTEMAPHRERVRNEIVDKLEHKQQEHWKDYSEDQLRGMIDHFGEMAKAAEGGEVSDGLKPWLDDFQKRFGENASEIAKKNVEDARAELQRRSTDK